MAQVSLIGKLKKFLYDTMEVPASEDRQGLVYELFMSVLIVLNAIAMIIGTVGAIQQEYDWILLVFGAIGVILWIGGHDVVAGRLSGGALSAFVFYAVIVATSVGTLSEVFGDLQRAAGATERLFELLGTAPTIRAPRDPVALPVPPRGTGGAQPHSPLPIDRLATLRPNCRHASSTCAVISAAVRPAVARAEGIIVMHSLVSMKRAASRSFFSSPSGTATNPCLSAWISWPGFTRAPNTSTSQPQRTGQA